MNYVRVKLSMTSFKSLARCKFGNQFVHNPALLEYVLLLLCWLFVFFCYLDDFNWFVPSDFRLFWRFILLGLVLVYSCDYDSYRANLVWEGVNFALYAVVLVQLGVSELLLTNSRLHHFSVHFLWVERAQREQQQVD